MNAVRRAGIGLGAFLALLLPCGAASLRVVHWTVEDASSKPAAPEVAAATLKPIKPDVILLEHLPDPRFSEQLVEALKPDVYQVLICSSFRHPQLATLNRHQAAILARQGACSAGSQTWRLADQTNFPGGCIFAALQTEAGRIGFFCVQLDDQLAQAVAGPQTAATVRLQAFYADQWIRGVDLCHHWPSNSIDAVVVGGAMEPVGSDKTDAANLESPADYLKHFLAAPLDDVCAPAAATGPAGLQPQPARLTIKRDALSGLVFNTAPAVCDLNLTLAPPPAPVAQTPPPRPAEPEPAPPPPSKSEPAPAAPVKSVEPEPQAQEQAPPPAPTNAIARGEPKAAPAHPGWMAKLTRRPILIAGMTAGLAGSALVIFLVLRRRRKSKAAEAQKPDSPAPAPAPDAAPAPQPAPAPAPQTGPTATPTPASMAPPPAPTSTSAAPANAGASAASTVQVVVPEAGRSLAQPLPDRVQAAEQRAEAAEAAVRAGLLPQVSRWLKEKLVSRLLSDRKQLLEAQEAATLQARQVDERLSQLEGRITTQNQAYEKRIEELTRELRATKEENREMIRVMIAQVEAEREAAQAKLLAEAGAPANSAPPGA